MNKVLLFLFVCGTSISQTTLDLKFYDSCSDNFVNLDFSMYSSEIFDIEYHFNSVDSLNRIMPGSYFFDMRLKVNETDYSILRFSKQLLKEEGYSDIIEIPNILKRLKRTSQYADLFLGYFNCGEICNGYVAGYYRNGGIRMEGYFENGIPNNWIKKYDVNEKLVEMIIYDKRGNLKEVKRFDEK